MNLQSHDMVPILNTPQVQALESSQVPEIITQCPNMRIGPREKIQYGLAMKDITASQKL